jgi:hypothetical protein
MKMSIVCTAAIAAMATTAVAAPVAGGDVVTGALLGNSADVAAAQMAHLNALPAFTGLFDQQSGVTNQTGPTLTFGSIGTGAVSSNLGAFYLGTAAGLEGAQNGVWYNTIDPGNNNAAGLAALNSGFTGSANTVLGFGNNATSGSGSPAGTGGNFSDNVVTITFGPVGVQGFIFNFADVGDVSGTELEVSFNGGATIFTTSMDSTGYFSLIAHAGSTIDSITLTQNADRNDGFLMYGFTTLTVVPLPPAAWAGLAMLGGVAGVRKLRRR